MALDISEGTLAFMFPFEIQTNLVRGTIISGNKMCKLRVRKGTQLL